MFFFSKKKSEGTSDINRSLLQQSDASDDSFFLQTTFKGMKVAGHINFVSFDLLQVEIDSPYSDLRDGYYNDFAEIPEKYWYVKDNGITEFCRRDAKKLLIQLYQAAYLFNHEPRTVQKALLHGIELGNEYYANKDASNKEIVEAYSIDQNGKVRKIADYGELALMKDTRPFEEQRDYFILNRILDRLYFDYKVWIDRDVLTQLIKGCFGVSLVYPNRLEMIISERLQEPQRGKYWQRF